MAASRSASNVRSASVSSGNAVLSSSEATHESSLIAPRRSK
jgi:hypothetical protein